MSGLFDSIVRGPAAEDVPGFAERTRMRRRARYLRSLRELQLRDLGGFLLELHRFSVQRPELVAAKLAHAAETDAELRALEAALGEAPAMREVREPGIGGACAICGAVHGSLDRYCATCGEPLHGAASVDGDPRPPAGDAAPSAREGAAPRLG